MTTKHLSGYYPSGYALAAGVGELVIDRTAFVGGAGVDAAFSATIVNEGRVYGSVQGVSLAAGGSLTNGSATNGGASITGYTGVKAAAAAAIANFGTIQAIAPYGDGVVLGAGGSLTNGSARDFDALIGGYYAVRSAGAAAIISNFGVIEAGRTGVALYEGGTLTNGSAADTRASIDGVRAWGAAATVNNFGTIAGYFGVYAAYGGKVVNGGAGDATAVISGYSSGAEGGENLTLANYGAIESLGFQGAGVAAVAGGTITNGTAADKTALISGYSGCDIGGLTTLINRGTIRGSVDGVDLSPAGAFLINGSDQNTTALITGRVGLYSNAPGLDRISNFGTIQGSAAGVTLRYADAVLINGSSTDREALIAGGYGIFAYDRAQSGSVTITNFGTIKGADGVAVKLTGAGDELIAEAGSTFIGAIEGGAGRLALAGGETGIITGLGGEGTLSGAVDADFSGFASYEIAVGGTWTLAGSNVLNAGAALVDRGALINRGALTSSGTLSVAASAVFTLDGGGISAGPTGAARIVDYGLMLNSAGTGRITVGAHMFDQGVVEAATGALDFTDRLFGTGALKIDGEATLEADAGAISTLSVDFDGPSATLALKSARTFDASLHGLSVGDVVDLLAAKATGASVDESDQLVIVDGARIVASLQLSGNYAGATFTTSSDGHGGTDVTLTSAADANLPSIHRMAAAMACLAPAPGVALPRRDLATNHAPVLATPLVQIS